MLFSILNEIFKQSGMHIRKREIDGFAFWREKIEENNKTIAKLCVVLLSLLPLFSIYCDDTHFILKITSCTPKNVPTVSNANISSFTLTSQSSGEREREKKMA